MKTFREKFIDFFKNEDTKKELKKMINPIVELIYDEIYIYLWILCVYHIFFICIILINFIILLKLYNTIIYPKNIIFS